MATDIESNNTTPMNPPMYKVITVQIKDFQRISFAHAEFDPNKNVIKVGGQNKQGKTAFLNAITSALQSIPKTADHPVRNGANEAFIRLTLGEDPNRSGTWTPRFIIDRTIKRDGDKHSTASTITDLSPDARQRRLGATYAKELLGLVMIDPLAFLKMEPVEQRRYLVSKFNIPVDEIDERISARRDKDRELNRIQIAAEERVKTLDHFSDVKETREIDPADILREIESATTHNNRIIAHKLRYDAAAADVERCKAALAEAIRRVEEIGMPAEVPIDEAVIAQKRVKLDSIVELNRKIRANLGWEEARAAWMNAEAQTKENLELLAADMDERVQVLKDAKLPLPGLAIDETYVTYNGLTLREASAAEQIVVATALSAVGRSELRLVLIRDASLMDDEMLSSLVETCERLGAQAVLEVVANKEDGKFDTLADVYMDDGVAIQIKPEDVPDATQGESHDD